MTVVDGRDPTRAHILALDGLRAIAIAMVIVFHFFQFTPLPESRLLRMALRITFFGQTGVDLFFVLSGFLITGILLGSKDSRHFFQTFYARRTLRIFPLYYTTLFTIYFVVPWVASASAPRFGEQLLFWIYASNLESLLRASFVGFTNFTAVGPAHFWSLAVEEQFYLVWPLVIYRIPFRALPHIIVLICVIALVLRIVLPRFDVDVYTITFCRMDSLGIGSLIAVVLRLVSPKVVCRVFAIVTAFAIVVTIPLYVFLGSSHSATVAALKPLLVALIYAGVLVWVLHVKAESWTARLLSNGAIRSVGRFSYAMYVFHIFVINWVAQRQYDFSFMESLPSSVQVVLRFVAVCVITYCAGAISWHLFEKHFNRLKRYFEYENEPTLSR